MIERIRFKNFKALKDAEIKLGPFNLIVGPNGSGKSTVFQALHAIGTPEQLITKRWLTVGVDSKEQVSIDAAIKGWIPGLDRVLCSWGPANVRHQTGFNANNSFGLQAAQINALKGIRSYALDPSKIAESVQIQPTVELQRTGANLSGVLDHIRNVDEDAYNALRMELQRWLPEYDNIVFETPQQGHRSFRLRRACDRQQIPSTDLSEGTLFALCLLTIAYNPVRPPVICLEEPDRALHPRLLREVKDALYRLAFPGEFGLERASVQVIATTHSPYFLDLFKEHPEQVIIAEKQFDGTAKFRNLSDEPNLREIIGDAPLGEVWYSGILGGVPTGK